jgi:hypothetical protein
MAAVAGFASWQSRVVAQRRAFRAGLSPAGLMADRGRFFAAWGRCAATRAFLPRGGLASGRRSGRRTMAAGWSNAAGVCGAAVWVAAPSRLAPCVRSRVVVTELGFRFPRFRRGPRVSGPLAAEERPVGTDATGAAFRLHEAKETVRPGQPWLRPRSRCAPDAAAVPAEKVVRPASGHAGFGRWLFRRALRSHAVAR